jgi:hypothetical protein
LILQVSLAPRVPGDLSIRTVCSAIDFDYEPARKTCEIYDEMVDGDLLAKLAADLLQLSQLAPKPALSARSVSSKLPRSFVGHGARGDPHP